MCADQGCSLRAAQAGPGRGAGSSRLSVYFLLGVCTLAVSTLRVLAACGKVRLWPPSVGPAAGSPHSHDEGTALACAGSPGCEPAQLSSPDSSPITDGNEAERHELALLGLECDSLVPAYGCLGLNPSCFWDSLGGLGTLRMLILECVEGTQARGKGGWEGLPALVLPGVWRAPAGP